MCINIPTGLTMKKLNPISEARRYEGMIKRLKNNGKTKGFQEALHQKTKIPKSTLSRKLKLLKLDDEIQALIENNLLDASFAEILFELPVNKRYETSKYIINNGLSFREAKKIFVDKQGSVDEEQGSAKEIKIDPDTNAYLSKLEDYYGISFEHHADKHEAAVEIKSWDESLVKDLMLLPLLWTKDIKFKVVSPDDRTGRSAFSLQIFHKVEDPSLAFNVVGQLFTGYEKLLNMRKSKR